MNFLAHSLFGFNDSELTAGQFCGDFVRGSDLSRFPDKLECGIRLHRYLDSFTDAHPVLSQARRCINEVPLRFSGIVIDVMFDHYLARRWDELTTTTLERHAQFVHLSLEKNVSYFPEPLKRFMVVLERERTLQSNIHLDSIRQTLSRIAGRSEKYSALALNTKQLAVLRDALVAPFDEFLPDLNSAARLRLAQASLAGNDSLE